MDFTVQRIGALQVEEDRRARNKLSDEGRRIDNEEKQ